MRKLKVMSTICILTICVLILVVIYREATIEWQFYTAIRGKPAFQNCESFSIVYYDRNARQHLYHLDINIFHAMTLTPTAEGQRVNGFLTCQIQYRNGFRHEIIFKLHSENGLAKFCIGRLRDLDENSFLIDVASMERLRAELEKFESWCDVLDHRPIRKGH